MLYARASMQHPAEAARSHPRPIPEILETAGRLYRERLVDFYALAAVVLLSSWTVNLVIRIWTLGEMPLGALGDPRAPEFFRRIGQVFGAGVANGMVYALLNSIASAILTIVVAARVQGRRLGMSDGVRQAAPRFAPVLGATLLYFVAVAALVGVAGVAVSLAAAGGYMARMSDGAIALALSLLAGLVALVAVAASGLVILYLTLRWALYPQVAVLERAGPLESIRQSARLTKETPGSRVSDRYLFRAAVLMSALVLLQIIAGTIGGVPEYGVGLLFGESGDRSVISILNPTGMPLYLLIPVEIFSVLLSATVYPYGVIVFVLLYLDVRQRRGAVGAAGATGATMTAS